MTTGQGKAGRRVCEPVGPLPAGFVVAGRALGVGELTAVGVVGLMAPLAPWIQTQVRSTRRTRRPLGLHYQGVCNERRLVTRPTRGRPVRPGQRPSSFTVVKSGGVESYDPEVHAQVLLVAISALCRIRTAMKAQAGGHAQGQGLVTAKALRSGHTTLAEIVASRAVGDAVQIAVHRTQLAR